MMQYVEQQIEGTIVVLAEIVVARGEVFYHVPGLKWRHGVPLNVMSLPDNLGQAVIERLAKIATEDAG